MYVRMIDQSRIWWQGWSVGLYLMKQLDICWAQLSPGKTSEEPWYHVSQIHLEKVRNFRYSIFLIWSTLYHRITKNSRQSKLCFKTVDEYLLLWSDGHKIFYKFQLFWKESKGKEDLESKRGEKETKLRDKIRKMCEKVDWPRDENKWLIRKLKN